MSAPMIPSSPAVAVAESSSALFESLTFTLGDPREWANMKIHGT